MNHARLVIAATAFVGLSGCLAKAAVDVVTAPVKVAGKAVDLATTSQSEADEKRGRELREREERIGRLERRKRGLDADCRDGDSDACDESDAVGAEIDALIAEPAGGRDRDADD